MQKRLQVKKRHHHVWAYYLSQWGNGTNKVFYTTATGKIAHDSVRGITVSDYFYKIFPLSEGEIKIIRHFIGRSGDQQHQELLNSLLTQFLTIQAGESLIHKIGDRCVEVESYLAAFKSNILEDLHASTEQKALPILKELSIENLVTLQDEKCMKDFLYFFGHQLARTKTFRDGFFSTIPMDDQLESKLSNLIPHAWWLLSYMFGINVATSLYMSRKTNGHALLINNTSVPFITSDQPITNVHASVSETELAPPKYADLYYPISPRVAYVICNSERFAEGKNEIDEPTVRELNSKVSAQAMTHIIGNTKEVIKEFQKFAGNRYRRAATIPERK